MNCIFIIYIIAVTIFQPDQHKEESVVRIDSEDFILQDWCFWI